MTLQGMEINSEPLSPEGESAVAPPSGRLADTCGHLIWVYIYSQLYVTPRRASHVCMRWRTLSGGKVRPENVIFLLKAPGTQRDYTCRVGGGAPLFARPIVIIPQKDK